MSELGEVANFHQNIRERYPGHASSCKQNIDLQWPSRWYTAARRNAPNHGLFPDHPTRFFFVIFFSLALSLSLSFFFSLSLSLSISLSSSLPLCYFFFIQQWPHLIIGADSQIDGGPACKLPPSIVDLSVFPRGGGGQIHNLSGARVGLINWFASDL